jgi:hypothetical protein
VGGTVEPLATRDARIIDHAKALGLDIVAI